jgi:hypothetical protein
VEYLHPSLQAELKVQIQLHLYGHGIKNTRLAERRRALHRKQNRF